MVGLMRCASRPPGGFGVRRAVVTAGRAWAENSAAGSGQRARARLPMARTSASSVAFAGVPLPPGAAARIGAGHSRS